MDQDGKTILGDSLDRYFMKQVDDIIKLYQPEIFQIWRQMGVPCEKMLEKLSQIVGDSHIRELWSSMLKKEQDNKERVVNSIDCLGCEYQELCHVLGKTPCNFSSDTPLLEMEKCLKLAVTELVEGKDEIIKYRKLCRVLGKTPCDFSIDTPLLEMECLNLAISELVKEKDERITSFYVMIENESGLCKRLGLEPLNLNRDMIPTGDQLNQLKNHITFLKNELVKREEKFVSTRNAVREVMQQLGISAEIGVEVTAAAGEIESPAPNKPLTLRYSYKDDQWSPLNPEGKKTYDRCFLLECAHNPASQRKPEGLPNLEVVRDKALTTKRLDFTPNYLKLQVPGISKRSLQQGKRGLGGDQGMGSQMQATNKMDKVRIVDVASPQHSGLLGSSGSQQLSSDNLATRSVRDAPKVKPSAFLNQCLYRVLRRGRHDRKKAGCLFKGAVKRGSFCHNDILEGFAELLRYAEDFLVGIPTFWEYVAEIVEPMLEEGVVPLTFLGPMSSSLDPSLAANFVAATLGEVVKAQGSPAALERLWSACNAQFGTVLPPGVDPVAFSKKNNLEFLLKLEPARSSDKPTSPNYSEFQQSLEQYLRGSRGSRYLRSTDDICSWIQRNVRGDICPAFIRALVTAVIESSIDGSAAESKLNCAVCKSWTKVLSKYVENVAERELQSLYAVQALVTKRHHPRGLIRLIFIIFYDSSVVSKDGFEAWVQSDDNSEREGKVVAINSVISFLTWLKEEDIQSDQEIEG